MRGFGAEHLTRCGNGGSLRDQVGDLSRHAPAWQECVMKIKTKVKAGKIYDLFPSGPAKGACK